MQLEEDKLKTQMRHALLDLEIVAKISDRSATDIIGPGNMVTTSHGIYLLAIGVGKVKIDGVDHYCISSGSPIGKQLIGKAVGGVINFNGREIEVLEIW